MEIRQPYFWATEGSFYFFQRYNTVQQISLYMNGQWKTKIELEGIDSIRIETLLLFYFVF